MKFRSRGRDEEARIDEDTNIENNGKKRERKW